MSLTKVAVFCAVYSLALWWRYSRFTLEDGAVNLFFMNVDLLGINGSSSRILWRFIEA
jgi:hypothetical protein